MSAFENILKHIEANKPEKVKPNPKSFGFQELIKLSAVPNTGFHRPEHKVSPWVYEVVIGDKTIYIHPELFYDRYFAQWSFCVTPKEGVLTFVYYQNNSTSTMQLAHDLYGRSRAIGFIRSVSNTLGDVFSHILKEYGNKRILHRIDEGAGIGEFKIVANSDADGTPNIIRIFTAMHEPNTVDVYSTFIGGPNSTTERYTPNVTIDELKEHSNLIGPPSKCMSESDRMRFFTELKKLIVKYSKEAA